MAMETYLLMNNMQHQLISYKTPINWWVFFDVPTLVTRIWSYPSQGLEPQQSHQRFGRAIWICPCGRWGQGLWRKTMGRWGDHGRGHRRGAWSFQAAKRKTPQNRWNWFFCSDIPSEMPPQTTLFLQHLFLIQTHRRMEDSNGFSFQVTF